MGGCGAVRCCRYAAGGRYLASLPYPPAACTRRWTRAPPVSLSLLCGALGHSCAGKKGAAKKKKKGLALTNPQIVHLVRSRAQARAVEEPRSCPRLCATSQMYV